MLRQDGSFKLHRYLVTHAYIRLWVCILGGFVAAELLARVSACKSQNKCFCLIPLTITSGHSERTKIKSFWWKLLSLKQDLRFMVLGLPFFVEGSSSPMRRIWWSLEIQHLVLCIWVAPHCTLWMQSVFLLKSLWVPCYVPSSME